jgi:hypothetical protein
MGAEPGSGGKAQDATSRSGGTNAAGTPGPAGAADTPDATQGAAGAAVAPAAPPAPGGRRLLLIAQTTLVGAFACLPLIPDRGRQFFAGASLQLLATFAYCWLARAAWRGSWRPSLPHALGLALGLRLLALCLTPALSTDLPRYLWDGRVILEGHNPYVATPGDPSLAHLRGPTWDQIAGEQLALGAVYPPAVELTLAGAVLLSPTPLGMKLVFGSLDLCVFLALWNWLRARGDPPQRALAHGLCPLAILEFAGEGHSDSLAILALVLALWASDAGGQRWAGIGLALATGGKLLPAALLPFFARRSLRVLLPFCMTLLLLYAPFLSAGAALFHSTEEYVARWRNNDTLFAALLGLGEWVGSWRSLENVTEPWLKEPQRLAKYPLALLTLLLLVWLWRRRAQPDRAARILLLWFIAASPTVHPWYVSLLVPFLALQGNLGLMLFTGTSYLGYHMLPGWIESGGKEWVEQPAFKIAAYLPFYAGIVVAAFRRERKPDAEAAHA